MTCAATWPAGAPRSRRIRRRGSMQPLALGGRQVPVDRRAQDRVGEADRAAGLHDPGGRRAPPSPPPGSAPASPASRAASPDLRAVAEHAERAGEGAAAGGSRASRSSTALATPRGTIAPTSAAAAARRSRGRGPPPRRGARRRGTDCRPLPRRHARTNRSCGIAEQPRGDQCADRLGVSGAGRSSSAAGSATSVAASGVRAGSSGRVARMSPSGCPSSRRAMNASARADGASHHCRSSTTQDERRRRRRGSTRASRGRAATRSRDRRRSGRRRRGRTPASASVSTSAGQCRRARQPPLALVRGGLEQRPLEELAHDAEREALFELGRPRARGRAGRAPAPARVPPRAAATSRSPRRPRRPRLAAPPGHRAQRGADALDLVLALEQRVRPGE